MLTLQWQHVHSVCQYNVKMSMIHWAFDFKTDGDFFFVHYHFGRKKPMMNGTCHCVEKQMKIYGILLAMRGDEL